MTVYTIGYGGRDPQDLVATLTEHRVRTVVDVRLRPDRASMGAYTKARTPDKGIQRLLAKDGIDYVSLPELGNVFLECDDWQRRYRRLFERAGELLTERLSAVPEPYCLLCAEREVTACHRQAIADFLRSRGCEIEHLE